jgi:hypothetical protein
MLSLFQIPQRMSSGGILEQSVGGYRNRVGIGLSYRADRLHGLAESIPGLLKSLKYRLSCFNKWLKGIFSASL